MLSEFKSNLGLLDPVISKYNDGGGWPCWTLVCSFVLFKTYWAILVQCDVIEYNLHSSGSKGSIWRNSL